MANEVYTDYWFEGNIPEEFSKLNSEMSIEEIGKLFGVELENERWYICESDVEKNKAHVNVWSAWWVYEEPWQLIANKYGLKMTYFACNELPYYFDSNYDDGAKYIVYYDYEDPEEWYYGEYDYFDSTKQVLEFLKRNEITEFRCISKMWYHEWYDEELRDEDYTYTLEDLQSKAKYEEEDD